MEITQQLLIRSVALLQSGNCIIERARHTRSYGGRINDITQLPDGFIPGGNSVVGLLGRGVKTGVCLVELRSNIRDGFLGARGALRDAG